MGIERPYQEFEKHEAWKVIEGDIQDLQSNGNIIVGYVVKLFREAS